jgi:hypothetical protein
MCTTRFNIQKSKLPSRSACVCVWVSPNIKNESDYVTKLHWPVFVMVKCCVFFAVRTEFLNVI